MTRPIPGGKPGHTASPSRPRGSRHAGLAPFTGFPKDTVTFLRALARNNDEAWMDVHRARYEAAILTPARQCVVDVGPALHASGCRVVADPRVNGSIFRIARDRRFRPDAPPYKSHLALAWWAAGGKRLEQPAFYLQISGKSFELGVGLPEVPRDRLPAFRRWLVQGDHAERMMAAMQLGTDSGAEWTLRQLVRPPLAFRGVEGARAAAVRYTGGWGGWTFTPHPPELFTSAFTDWFVERCRPLMPYFHELAKALRPSRQDT